MSQQVEIICGTGADAYTVRLTGKDLETFYTLFKSSNVLQSVYVTKKSGEDLVAEILSAAKGKVSNVSRFKKGMFNDGPQGQPAVQEFDCKGKTILEMHYLDGQKHGPTRISETDTNLIYRYENYKNGKLNNDNGPALLVSNSKSGSRRKERIEYFTDGISSSPCDGRMPALQVFNEAGRVVLLEYKKDGKRHDGAGGYAAAFQKFNDDGLPTRKARYTHGKLHDGPNGWAAVEELNASGAIVYVARYTQGTMTQEMKTPEEILAYRESVHTESMLQEMKITLPDFRIV